MRREPVAKLLGGMFRTRVEAYATGFYRIKGHGEARAPGQASSKRTCANGFRALKIKLGFGIEDDLAVMRAISKALQKTEEVMIDVNHAYGVADAIRLGRELEDMGWRLRWYEEPVVQEDLDGYAEVRRALATPIAGGENEYTLFGFKQSPGPPGDWILRNRTSASPAASPAAATSSRWRTRTACR